jgi:hypothetical protein
MSAPHGGAASIFRDFETGTTGPLHKPSKPEVRDWGKAIESLVFPVGTFADLALLTGLQAGWQVSVANGNLGVQDVGAMVAAGTYPTPDNRLVRNVPNGASPLQWVSLRATFQTEAEVTADVRTFVAGTYARIQSIDATIQAISTGTADYTGAGGQKWTKVFDVSALTASVASDESRIAALEAFGPTTAQPIVTGGTSTAYTISSGLTSYDDGRLYTILLHTDCGASPTLKDGSLAAVPIKRRSTSGALISPVASELKAGVPIRVVYSAADTAMVLASGTWAANGDTTSTGRMVDPAFVAAALQGGALVQAAAVAAAGQTAITFSGIPSWVKRITVCFSGLSTSGSAQVIIQLGTSGGPKTSGYLGTGMDNATGSNVQLMSSGFLTQGISANSSAAGIRHGAFFINSMSSNIWAFMGIGGKSDSALNYQGSGSVSLGGTLTSITITTMNGTDTFDAGSVNILWE